MRNISTRFDVVRNGVRYSELLARDKPTVQMVADAEIKMTLSGEFAKTTDINYLSDHIRLYLIIDGTAFPLGEYVVGTKTSNLNGDNIEAYDQALIVQQDALTERLSLAAGALYTDTIQQLLIDCGISRIICDPCADALQTAREDWEIGTSILAIVNQLLSEINFNSLWFDLDGIARLEKYSAPNVDNIDRAYKDDEFSIIKPEYTSEQDIYKAYNVFTAMCSNPDLDEPLYATAKNENPSSMLSTIQRGREIVAPIYKVDNIASQEALQEYINNVCNNSMISTETVDFTTALNPVHLVGDTLELSNGDIQGVFAETEWSLTMGAGELMKHRAKRVTYA